MIGDYAQQTRIRVTIYFLAKPTKCTIQDMIHTVQIAFAILRLRLKRKTHPAFRVLNTFYYQTDFNLRFKCKRDVRLTCKRV